MPETNLATLISAMTPRLRPGLFVFITIPPGTAIPGGIAPIMMFQEVEGMTLIAPREQASAAGLPSAFPSRMITLDIHSSLEAVGFLAAVTTRLAAAGIAVNAVSAFHHDHLFVPEARADEAIAILQAMARERKLNHKEH
jgi:uncharacterized protein